MSSLSRPLWSLLAGLACLGASRSAAAWIESSVLSDAVIVEVDPEGRAIVSHDLWMKVRGGPLKGAELEGIDSDAEPLPNAVVTKITASGGADQTKPLLLSRGDDDTLRLEVDDSTGVRNGTYAFRFKYRTDLRQRSRIAARGSWAELTWIGPRYRAGLDVAKVTFKLPHAPTAPRLPEIDPSADELAQGELPTAALLSTLRRGAEADELELVRPHVAKGEPVLWRVWCAPTVFSWLATAKGEQVSVASNTEAVPRGPLGKGLPLLLAGGLALVSAFLVQLKHRAVESNTRRQGCLMRPLLPWGVHLRAIATGVLLATSVLLAVRFDAPTLAAMALVLSLACMTYRHAVLPRRLRGPGRWLPVRSEEAFARRDYCVESKCLDASTAAGKLVLSGWYAAVLSVAAWLFHTQPYLALLMMLASTIALPVLLTGGTSNLPIAHERQARQHLEWIYRRLNREEALRVHPVGRFADGESAPDEIRLKISAASMPAEILGIEVAVHGTDREQQPCLLVRLRDGVENCRDCTAGGALLRGRTPQERVYVFAPTLAARRRVVAEIKRLLGNSRERLPGHSGGVPQPHDAIARGGASAKVKSVAPASRAA